MRKYNQLLSINSDSKTIKGLKKGYLTGIMYLSPSKISGKNFCSSASKGCILACLNLAGRGVFNSVQLARYNKSRYFIEDQKNFMLDLVESIIRLKKKAINKGLIPVVRLNGTSDLLWENIKISLDDIFFTSKARKYILDNSQYFGFNPSFNTLYKNKKINIMELFSDVTFYDYTKHKIELRKNALKLNNYNLTFSRCEDNESKALNYLINGYNSAFVFKNKIPSTYKGFKVFNGDESDLRFLDPKNCIIGLIAKGSAKKDNTGFVINN